MLRETHALALLTAYKAELNLRSNPWGVKPADLAAGRAILGADVALQVAVIRTALPTQVASVLEVRRTNYQNAFSWQEFRAVDDLLHLLIRRSLPFTSEDICAVLQALRQYGHPDQGLLRALTRSLRTSETLAACRPDLERVRAAANTWYGSADQRKFLKLLDEILGDGPVDLVPIRPDEWGDQVGPLLDAMDAATAEQWVALLRHCANANGSAPSTKWLTTARQLVDELGAEKFGRLAAVWLGAFRKSGNKPPEHDPRTYERTSQGCLLVEENADLLRGLAWMCSLVDDASLAAVLADGAIAAYRKISGVGPRSAKVAGACVYALKSMPGLYGAAQLERVRLGVKQPTYLKAIEMALDEAAGRSGMSREDLEELTVPTFGLEDGRLRIPIGNSVAELTVAGSDVSIQWRDADGKPRKSEPVEVKRDHKADLKDLKRVRDEITHMLAAQRDRLERLPLSERRWTLPSWRERYLDHALIGGLARRLIWRFTDGERTADGIWLAGQLVDADDRPLELSEAAHVTAWHPALCSANEVLAWRNWLERHQVTQPFKQVHREVYLLTDAERATRIYSNRFAGHILRQHQFNALAGARGWRNKLRLMVDDTYPPATLELTRWGLRAEFWIEGAGDNYGTDTNDTGTYLYVATDQVRFYHSGAAANYAHASGGGYSLANRWGTLDQRQLEAPVPLEEIPLLVFSEVMRDVDLFVGVASVGNDPTWQDGGPQGRYRDYWQSYSFGELSATAETRKQLLARLVPQLTIGDRCTIEGRFLKVRGDVRTYKIHLGSGNILMEPNDQYLCIVPGRGDASSATEQLFLPFEGDSVLAVILSKAFLLADDGKISDTTITRQIGVA